jgi:hypothetical protein
MVAAWTKSLMRMLLLAAILCGLAISSPAYAADAARPAPTSLSASQLKKLDNLLADDGADQQVPPAIAARLGLSLKVIKQVGVVDKQTSDLHAYARLPDGGVLLTFFDFAKTKLAYTSRLDPTFKVVASMAMAKAGESAVADAQAGAMAELSYWAQVADQL